MRVELLMFLCMKKNSEMVSQIWLRNIANMQVNGYCCYLSATLLTDPNVVQDLLREEENKTRGLVEKYSIKMKNAHVSICLSISNLEMF